MCMVFCVKRHCNMVSALDSQSRCDGFAYWLSHCPCPGFGVVSRVYCWHSEILQIRIRLLFAESKAPSILQITNTFVIKVCLPKNSDDHHQMMADFYRAAWNADAV